MRTCVRRILSCIAVAGILFTTAGCATLADSQRARGTGESKIYNVSSEQIWDAMQNVVAASGLEYIGENRKKGYVLAQRGITAFSFGENVAIFIEPQADGKTRVEVVSKKAMATNVFAPNWAGPIFKQLDERF